MEPKALPTIFDHQNFGPKGHTPNPHLEPVDRPMEKWTNTDPPKPCHPSTTSLGRSRQTNTSTSHQAQPRTFPSRTTNCDPTGCARIFFFTDHNVHFVKDLHDLGKTSFVCVFCRLWLRDFWRFASFFCKLENCRLWLRDFWMFASFGCKFEKCGI